MKIVKIYVILLVLIFTSVVTGVGSFTEVLTLSSRRSGIRKLTLSWVATVTGAVDTATTTLFDGGEILRVVFIPGTATVFPTDQYDVTIEDTDDVDVLNNMGINLSSVTTQQFVPLLISSNTATGGYAGMFCVGPLELKVANAGTAGTGTGRVIIYWR